MTSATVGLWSLPGAVPVSLGYSFGTTAFASDLAGGTATLSNSFLFHNGRYDVFLSSFQVDLALGAGDYWFTLGDGRDSADGGLFWDINFGPSQAQFGNAGSNGSIDSEYFLLSDDATTAPDPGTNPVPEPVSIALLAAGAIGFAASRRRRPLPCASVDAKSAT